MVKVYRFNFRLVSIVAILLLPGMATAAIYHSDGSVSSLISNINAANATDADDIIDLGGFIYTFAIAVSPSNPDGASSALPVIASGSGKLSIINGAIERSFALDQNTPFRLIYNQGNLSLFNITLENGLVLGHRGGAIYNDNNGFMNIDNTTIYGNQAQGAGSILGDAYGGGIYNIGTINMIDSVVANNKANAQLPVTSADKFHAYGGGIYNNGILDAIINSIFSDNQANGGTGAGVGFVGGDSFGGGIYNAGTINSIANSLWSDNQASGGNATTSVAAGPPLRNGGNGQGGGIYNSGSLASIINSTFFGNQASGGNGGNLGGTGTTAGNGGNGNGGGIFNAGEIQSITNSTLSGNQTTSGMGGTGGGGNGTNIGGGIFNQSTINNLVSDIIAANIATSAPDISSIAISNEGYNLFSTTPVGFSYNMSTDIIQSNAGTFLGALQANGGPTDTIALLPGSLAINNGSNPSLVKFDQRDAPFHRVCGSIVDIGSYELQHLCGP